MANWTNYLISLCTVEDEWLDNTKWISINQSINWLLQMSTHLYTYSTDSMIHGDWYGITLLSVRSLPVNVSCGCEENHWLGDEISWPCTQKHLSANCHNLFQHHKHEFKITCNLFHNFQQSTKFWSVKTWLIKAQFAKVFHRKCFFYDILSLVSPLC